MPGADMIYGCDAAWWAGTQFDWRSASGLKVCAQAGPHVDEGVRRVAVTGDTMLFDLAARLGGGGNSGFQALNLLAQMGAARIALLGLDAGGGGATHWHGPGWPFGAGGSRLQASQLDRWRRSLDGAAPLLSRLGVRVVNASPVSALTAFAPITLDEVIDTWDAPSS